MKFSCASRRRDCVIRISRSSTGTGRGPCRWLLGTKPQVRSSKWADHAVVSRRSLVKIDRELPFREAALFGCAVLTGVGAVVNTAAVKVGQTVAIVGLGGVGLASLLGAIAAGAAAVIAVDLSDDKLALARTLFERVVTINARDNPIEHVRDLTRGGVDVAIEMAGSVRA